MFIERPPEWYRKLFPGAIFRMPSSDDARPRVFLTFDDGPIPEVTPWVLSCLEDFGVKATFFMVGQNIERYPWLLQEVISKGHKVGNHTLHHIQGRGKSSIEYFEDAKKGEILTNSKLFRPPHGWLSRSQLTKVSEEYKVIMFDLVTRDYSSRLTADDVIQNVKKLARNGSIIVFHDSLKSLPRLKEALPSSLKWLLSEGYSFELCDF